jgi:AraC family transcriptional regulator, transcriptional activator of pobA
MEFFKEINELIIRTGFPELTHLPDFHIIQMRDAGANFVKMMPPHRQDFFQIGFQSQMLSTKFSLQSKHFSDLKNLLYFVAPQQTMSWVVEQQNEGYILYFKRSFLDFLSKTIEEAFPFFQLIQTSLYELDYESSNLIINELNDIRSAFEDKSPYQSQRIQGFLLAFLYRCKVIVEGFSEQETQQAKPQILAQKYQQLVYKFFLEKRKIEDYANLLNVTPNYLSTVIKATTNRNAKSFIDERLLVESKNLLTYTQADISEIAYQLGFNEVTHFGRFFKKETNESPSDWRKKNIKS